MKEELTEILSFCISSAIGCVDEPAIYGPLRLVEVMEKLIDFGVALEITSDTEWSEIKKQITEKKTLCMIDEDQFKQFLREIAYLLVEKQIAQGLNKSQPK